MCLNSLPFYIGTTKGFFALFELELELELELIHTQMALKPMLRAEVYAHALNASQNCKVVSVQRAGRIIRPPPLEWPCFSACLLSNSISSGPVSSNYR